MRSLVVLSVGFLQVGCICALAVEDSCSYALKGLFEDYVLYVPNYLIPRIFKNELARTNSILDLGTGTARELPVLAKILPTDSRITAVDLSGSALELAVQQLRVFKDLGSEVQNLSPAELKGLMIALEGLGYRYVDYLDPKYLDDRAIQYLRDRQRWSEPKAIHFSLVGDKKRIYHVRKAIASLKIDLSRSTRISFVQADAVVLPFSDQAFEIVLLNDLSMYFDSKTITKVLREAQRVAKKTVMLTLYPTSSEGGLISGDTTMLTLPEAYWQLALELLNLGVDVSEIVTIEGDLGTAYRKFVQENSDRIDIGYFYKKVQSLRSKTKREHLTKKYFLQPNSFFFTHDPAVIAKTLGPGTIIQEYSGGEMFSARRNLIVWRR